MASKTVKTPYEKIMEALDEIEQIVKEIRHAPPGDVQMLSGDITRLMGKTLRMRIRLDEMIYES